MDSGCLKLSENIQFVWSERSYSGDKRGCHACGQRRTTNNGRNVKIELEFWEAEFAISCPHQQTEVDFHYLLLEGRAGLPRGEASMGEVGENFNNFSRMCRRLNRIVIVNE